MELGSCRNCEDIQRGGKSPRCLVCIYYNASIFNKPEVPKNLEYDFDDTAVTFKLIASSINNENNTISKVKPSDDTYSKFADIYAEKSEIWKANGIDCESIFGYIDEDDAENESKPEFWYFTFPCYFSLRTNFVKVYGTRSEARKVIEQTFKDIEYVQRSIEAWQTPNHYTKTKPCDCYIEWTI